MSERHDTTQNIDPSHRGFAGATAASIALAAVGSAVSAEDQPNASSAVPLSAGDGRPLGCAIRRYKSVLGAPLLQD